VSARVPEEAGFACEGTLRRHFVFPNLSPGEPLDVLCYALVLG
jgi:RimJ/RimL family protein N-acetyltransferase